jgi:hypothetical protein
VNQKSLLGTVINFQAEINRFSDSDNIDKDGDGEEIVEKTLFVLS